MTPTSSEGYFRDAEEESQRLVQAMREYEEAIPKNRKGTSNLSRTSHTWADVLKEIDDATTLYNEPSGRWGKIRNGFRKFGDKAGLGSVWLTLLPSQSDYFSILCGGLTLIIGVSNVCYVY